MTTALELTRALLCLTDKRRRDLPGPYPGTTVTISGCAGWVYKIVSRVGKVTRRAPAIEGGCVAEHEIVPGLRLVVQWYPAVLEVAA